MTILRVALDSPLRCLFDYLPPADQSIEHFVPGQRLRVPFGRHSGVRIGLLMALSDHTEVARDRLKRVLELLDVQPVMTTEQLQLIIWASAYYHHPVGYVAFTAMPALLRQGKPAQVQQEYVWQLTESARQPHVEISPRAKKQWAVFNFIKQYADGVSRQQIDAQCGNSSAILRALSEKQLLVAKEAVPTTAGGNVSTPVLQLNAEQGDAVDTVIAGAGTYHGFLLNGVTGSGKTEVYMRVIRHMLDAGKQVLVLIPEIGLMTQFIEYFSTRLRGDIVALHSGLSARVRLSGWLSTLDGRGTVVLGTRSAVWAPMPNLGLIIVDEEHDLSYKQQDGLRYSARDVALIRGKRKNIPVILGSATPSMESIRNVQEGRYRELRLPHRISHARLPEIYIHDVRNDRMHGALSQYLLKSMRRCLSNGEQVLLFLNRRGYAPVMMCHDCGFIFQCSDCSAYMIFHKERNRLCCHHCGRSQHFASVCCDCGGSQIIEVGHGTERLGETLADFFPQARILRIDRDVSKRKGSMEKMLLDVHAGHADILVGTQILTKGHHFPSVTLVGVIDADRGLFSVDYRAGERMAQVFLQVSGRAGRGDKPGAVIVQTRCPGHPLLQALSRHNYQELTDIMLAEREQVRLPPFSFQALIRAEAQQQELAINFLRIAGKELERMAEGELGIYGPISALLERRAGRYRFQLVVQADRRRTLGRFLQPWVVWLEGLPEARKVRWSVDIDPQDML